MKEFIETRCAMLLEQAVEEKFIAGGSLLVLRNGERQFSCSAGWRDIEQNLPMQTDTILRLYSMTKPITAAAAMLLMERGVMDLYDPVSRYLPGFQNQTVAQGDGSVPVPREMMLRDLLSMTSGLPYPHPRRVTNDEVTTSFQALNAAVDTAHPINTVAFANLLGQNRLEFIPGTQWMYGTSADIMGAVIETVSGCSFGEFLQKEFFAPLEMEDTGFWVPCQKRNRLSKVYRNVDGRLQEAPVSHLGISYDMKKPPAFESGGAGLTSTLEDYAHFAAMLMQQGEYHGRQILQPATVHFLTSSKLLPWQQESMWRSWETLSGYSYGNFMRVMTDPGMSGLQGRTGEYGWDGWLGLYFANIPSTGMTVLLSMQRPDSGTTRLARQLRNILNQE